MKISLQSEEETLLTYLHLFTELFHKDFSPIVRKKTFSFTCIYLQNCFMKISLQSSKETFSFVCIYLQNWFMKISLQSSSEKK